MIVAIKIVFSIMTSINYKAPLLSKALKESGHDGIKDPREMRSPPKERNSDIDAIKPIKLYEFGQSRTMEDAIKLIEDFKLQVKFQMNTDINKVPHFYDGYSTHRIRSTDLHSGSIYYVKKPKTAVIFGRTFEKIARDNLNFFHYKFCQRVASERQYMQVGGIRQWSPTFGRYISGNKLLFNKDQTQWMELDPFIAESVYPLKSKPLHLKHEMFYLSVVVSTAADKELLAKVLETLDSRLPEAKLSLSGGDKPGKTRDCTVIVGSNFNATSAFKKSDNIFLEYPVVAALPDNSAVIFELSWLLSNSFFVFTVLNRVRTSLEKHNLDFHLLDRSVEQLWRQARIGVVVRYRVSPHKKTEVVLAELCKLGFAKLPELMADSSKRALAMLHLTTGLLLEVSADWRRARLLESDLYYALSSRVRTEHLDEALRHIFV